MNIIPKGLILINTTWVGRQSNNEIHSPVLLGRYCHQVRSIIKLLYHLLSRARSLAGLLRPPPTPPFCSRSLCSTESASGVALPPPPPYLGHMSKPGERPHSRYTHQSNHTRRYNPEKALKWIIYCNFFLFVRAAQPTSTQQARFVIQFKDIFTNGQNNSPI